MHVFIMQGASGSGKSTYVKENFGDATVVSADHFFMRSGKHIYDRSKIKNAHQFCWRSFLSAMLEKAQCIVVDNTNCTISEISPYVLPAETFGYRVEIISLDVDPNICIKQTILDVAEHVIRIQYKRMRQSWQQMPRYWQQTIIQDF